jgi:hypothetical protein
MRISLHAGALALVLAASTGFVSAAGTRAEFNAAYGAADAAERQAAGLRNQWTATAASLAEARTAAANGDFGRAIAAAKEAEALARASIFQARSEKEAWKDREIR